MALNAAHWSVTRSNGNIRYTGADHGVGGETYASVIELRRWLGQLSDDEAQADSSDEIAIYDEDPADRLGTDNIIRLKGLYNIDDASSEHLYDGSIIQGSGDTETIYDGFVNFGNADDIQIIQNGAVLTDDWWNLAAGGGVNANAAQGISHRFMLPVRKDGVDIDGRRVIGTSRRFSYTYSEFKVNGTSRGNNTLALSESLDLNNETVIGTVAGWTGITNTEGLRSIDVNNDGTNEVYYSEWNTNQPTRSINDFYERMKWLTRDGTASSLYGLNGEVFRGITHSIDYDTEVLGGLAELKLAVWGTTVVYDTEQAAGLTVGENYIFATSGARGQLLALDDDGVSGTAIFGLSDTTAIADGDIFNRADGTATDGATTNGAVTGEGDVWGTGLVLAKDATAGTVHIQLIKGSAPTDGVVMTEATLAGVYDTATDGTAAVNVTVTERNISTPFVGSSTGTSLVGAYGLGVEYLDLKAADKVTPLIGTVKSPPDNQTFTVSGVVSTEDRILVAPWDGSSTDNEGFPAIDVAQLTLSTSLLGATETAIVVTAAIPTDTPGSGTIRVQLDNGEYWYQTYTSWDTSTFTIPSTDYSVATGNGGATQPRNVYISYIDETASGTTATFTAQYIGDRNLVVIVRDGGGTPIKQYISSAVFNSGGGGSVVTRTSDE